jgi:hypothetical protein
VAKKAGVPILPGTKKPGRWRNGAWSDYPEWTRHAERPTTEHELDIWRTWPDAGVGIACGQVIGVDIDYPVHRFFRWAKVLELLMGGTTGALLRLGSSLSVAGAGEA